MAAMLRVGEVAPEDRDLSRLDLAGPGDEAHEGRFADAIGTDEPDHLPGGNVERDIAEGDDLAIAMGDPGEAGDGGGSGVGGSWRMGHGTLWGRGSPGG
jgi:hypothetical protein